MRLFVLALMAALAPAAVTAAETTPRVSLWEPFLADCVTPEAQPAASLAAAEAEGLVAAPQDMTQGAPLRHAEGRYDPVRHVMLMVGDMDSPKRVQGYHMQACLVASDRGDAAREEMGLQRWAAVPLFERNDSDVLYFFDQSPEGRRTLEGADDATLRRLAAQGRVRIAQHLRDEHISGFIFGVLRPDPPAAAPEIAAGETATATAPAPERTPFDDFTGLCVAHRGAIADSLKAAGDAGWMVAPRSLQGLAEGQLPDPMTSGDIRIRSTADDLELFIAGAGKLQVRLQLVRFSMCAIVQAPPADRTLLSAVNGWVGVEPVEEYPDGSKLFLFVEENGQHRSLGGRGMDLALLRLAKTGKVSIVVTQQGSASFAPAVAGYGVVTSVVDAYSGR